MYEKNGGNMLSVSVKNHVKWHIWCLYYSIITVQNLMIFKNVSLFFFQGSTSSTSSVGSNSSTGSMEVSTRNGLNGKTVTPVNTSNSAAPGTPNKHVNFGGGTGEEKKREKFLTAKYGAHQMALIRKRLRVEMWMYERLTEIYGAVSFLIFLS